MSDFSREPDVDYSNSHDRELGDIFERRESDWRNGAIVYQVIVDRFAPSADLDAKRDFYPAPKNLRTWDEVPTQGTYLEDHKVWSHEIDFWGGDLASTQAHLDWVQDLGADVLYLCPIHLAWTNHGYDALDYQQVRPEYGTRDDVKSLAAELHDRGMSLVLDGVFNHMGRNAAIFQEALNDPKSPYRSWFDFNEEYSSGARAWMNADNLPELIIENPTVRRHIWETPNSVVRSYLRDGVDGWRLDVAFEIGMRYLGDLTKSAHIENPQALVLGEITNYPQQWFPELDAVLHFTLREILLAIAEGAVSPQHGQAILQRFYADCDYEHLLKSWIYLDNHDVVRIATRIPDERRRAVALALQFTLPGSVNLYYGSELGMTGGDDPENRAPMRWDLATDDNRTLAQYRKLIQIRRDHRALKIGNLRWLVTDQLIGFERYTDKTAESVVVLINPSDEAVSEVILVPDSKITDHEAMIDHLSDQRPLIHRSLFQAELAPGQVMILSPDTRPTNGYSAYKRIQ